MIENCAKTENKSVGRGVYSELVVFKVNCIPSYLLPFGDRIAFFYLIFDLVNISSSRAHITYTIQPVGMGNRVVAFPFKSPTHTHT